MAVVNEFGHDGKIINLGDPLGVVCIDSWGAGPFVIEVKGKQFRFEDSDRFGPSLIKKNGDIRANQPGERSPFWFAHRAWRNQGRRVGEDGVTCIYDPSALSK